MDITIILCAIIVAVALGSYLYVYYLNEENLISQRRQRISQIPSMLSTLGVLGTFIGITLALKDFNPKNLGVSIPSLLEGLKTAFYTSLAGMICSIILNRYINRHLDEVEEADHSNEKAARSLTGSFQDNLLREIKALNNNLSTFTNKVNQIEQYIQNISTNVTDLKDDIDEIKDTFEAMNERSQEPGAIDSDVSQIAASVSTSAQSIATMDNTLEEVHKATQDMLKMVKSVAAEVKQMNDKE